MFRRRNAGRKGGRGGTAEAGGAAGGGGGGDPGKIAPKKGAPMLSFDDDSESDGEGGGRVEEFRIKRKGARAVGAPLPLAGAGAVGAQGGGGTYDATALAALRAAQHNAPAVKVRGSFKAAGDAIEGEERIVAGAGGLLAAPPPPPPSRSHGPPIGGVIAGDEADAMDADGSDEDGAHAAATAARARAERGRARAAGADADEFVPMTAHAAKMVADMAVDGETSGSDDGEDPREHLALAAASAPQSGRAPRGALGFCADPQQGGRRGSALGGAASDSEEERFEMEQLRRAHVQAHKQKAAGAGSHSTRTRGGSAGVRGAPGGRGDVSLMDVDAAADQAMEALRKDAAQLESRAEAMKREAASAKARHAQATKAAAELAESLTIAGERFSLAQRARTFVRDLCDMLQEKAPLLEELEETLRVAAERRADADTERRTADDAEATAQVEAEAAAALGALGKGVAAGSNALAESVAAAGAAAVEAVACAGSSGELDEFGRDPTAQARASARQRMDRRVRRQLAAEAAIAAGEHARGVESGASGSDSDAGGAEAFDAVRDSVLEAALTALADAAPEFATLEAVATFLDRWRCQWPQSFRDAYVPRSAPQLLAPFVRLEMLRWEPLWGARGAPASLDAMEWYGTLFEVGTEPATGETAASNDLDEMVPSLIELVCAPMLEHALRRCWRVEDAHQSERLADAVRELLVYVPAENESAKTVLAAASERLSEACERCVKVPPPVLPAPVLAASPAARRRCARRFAACVGILRACAAFDGVLDASTLASLAEPVVSSAVVPHVSFMAGAGGTAAAAAERRAERIAAILTGAQWLAGSPAGASAVTAFEDARQRARAR